uniref:ARF7EP_C domain-containing protein n=1 Tax=Heterorhabditis bacteriophora TaxID=37862 RepID=A0A1I7W6T9_HETBA
MLISHPDQLRMKRSISTHLIPEVERHQKKRKTRNTIDIVKQRIIRGIVDDSIDTVCFAGGLCSCAETSCGVQCGVCLRDTVENLRDHLSDDDSFGKY